MGKQLAEVVTTMDFQSHEIASESSCGSSPDDGSERDDLLLDSIGASTRLTPDNCHVVNWRILRGNA